MEPIRIGPRGEPKHTLAYDIFDWQWAHLRQPDGPNSGEPWSYTREQAHFVKWWYAVDDRGRFIYRRGVFRRLKGHGKDPLCATLAVTEFIGPCRFGGWDADGAPVAIPHSAPWVQITATSIEQTKNTSTLFPGLFAPAAVDEYGLDLGKLIIHSRAGGRIECITSSPRTIEGARPSFLIMNETQHWVASNEGHAMAQAIARNLAKSRDGAARSLAITNAHSPGEESVAERDWDAYEAIRDGRSKATGFLYDSLEAPRGFELSDRAKLREGLLAARGDSVWVDVDRLIEEIYDPTTPASVTRRYYLNQVTASEDAWIAPAEWDACQAGVGVALAERDVLCLGFDGSIRDDSTALVACRLSDGLIQPVGVWEQPDGPGGDGWQVDREAVHATVAETMSYYQVIGFYCDPAHWQDHVDSWTQAYGYRMLQPAIQGKPLEWWTHRPLAMIRALQRFREAVVTRELLHNGDTVLRRHVLNAKNRVGSQGVTIAKEHPQSKRKIDLAMAATLAYECRSDAIASRLQDRFARPRRAVSF